MYSGNNQTRIACSCGYELLLANTPTPPVNESRNYKIAETKGKIKASFSLLDDNTGTKLKETIWNDIGLLLGMVESTARQEAKAQRTEEIRKEVREIIANTENFHFGDDWIR